MVQRMRSLDLYFVTARPGVSLLSMSAELRPGTDKTCKVPNVQGWTAIW